MKVNEIQELFNSFESIAVDYEGVECWSAAYNEPNENTKAAIEEARSGKLRNVP